MTICLIHFFIFFLKKFCLQKKSNGFEKNNDEGKKNNGGGKKDDSGSMTDVVLKIELHCEGCASKITKFIRSLEGIIFI